MWRWAPRAGAALIIGSVVLINLPALGGGYLWDDQLYVRDNLALRSTAGLIDIWRFPPTTRQYYPLTFTSFWAEYRLWGAAPTGYRTTNILLHAANALLVWSLLSALEVPGAFAAAWIFAIHPVNVASVAWIAERKNVLCGLFSLLGTLAWLRFLGDERARWHIAASAFFACALLSKTQACGLPLVFLALAWWKQPRAWRRVIPALLPSVLIAFAAGAATLRSEYSGAEQVIPLPHLHGIDRVLLAGRALWFYAGQLLWPTSLMAIHGHWAIDAHAYAQYGFPLAIIVLVGLVWAARRHIGKGPSVALVAFGALLAPVSGLIDFNFMRFAFVADHFSYLASVAFIALAVATGDWLLVALASRSPPARNLDAPAVAVVAFVLGCASWTRAGVYHDEERLWRDTIARNPGCAAAHHHLGSVLLAQRRFDQATESFQAALRLDAAYAPAHIEWGNTLRVQGQPQAAIAHFQAALQIAPDDPDTHNSLGVAWLDTGDGDAAIREFAEAIRLAPRFAPAYNNWGAALFARGDYSGAIDRYAATLALAPAYVEAHDNWGVALIALQRFEEAIVHFAAAARLAADFYPAQQHWGEALQHLGQYQAAVEHHRAALGIDASRAPAHLGLGVALLNLDRNNEAIDALRTALALDPSSADAHHYLGVALAKSRRFDEAFAEFATAATSAPSDAEIQNHWGVALAVAGQRDAARSRFQEALRLQPDHAQAREHLIMLEGRRRTEPAGPP